MRNIRAFALINMDIACSMRKHGLRSSFLEQCYAGLVLELRCDPAVSEIIIHLTSQ